MIVCICAGASECHIREAIRGGATSLGELQDCSVICKVNCCRLCYARVVFIVNDEISNIKEKNKHGKHT